MELLMRDERSLEKQGIAILQVEVTTACNLRCDFCYNSDPAVRVRGTMSFKTYASLVDQVKFTCQRVNLWGAGEPFLHPDIFRMAEYARIAGIPQVKVSTNGHFLFPDNIDRIFSSGITHIRVSLESTDPVRYAQQRRGGSLSRVIEGVRRLLEQRAKLRVKLTVVLASVVSSAQEGAAADVSQLALLFGADKHHVIPNIWKDQFPGLRLEHPSQRCSQPISVFNVLANGEVIPCCYSYLHTIVIGNVHEQSINTIWDSNLAKETRAKFLRGTFAPCAQCNYGAILPQPCAPADH
jgi:radical SAM protein with 4Fe4S-binding SPASM domain